MSQYLGPARETIASGLIDRLNETVGSVQRPNRFERASIQRDINKLKAIDLPDYYDLSGILAAVCGDHEGMVTNHRKAIDVSGKNPYYLTHFAISLMKFYQFDEAESILLDLVAANPSDVNVLDELITLTQGQGRYFKAAEYSNRWSQHSGGKLHHDAKRIIDEQLPILRNLDISDDALSAAMQRAFDVLRRNEQYNYEIKKRWPSDPHGADLFVIINIPAPPEQIAQLNVDLAEDDARAPLELAGRANLVVSFAAVQ